MKENTEGISGDGHTKCRQRFSISITAEISVEGKLPTSHVEAVYVYAEH